MAKRRRVQPVGPFSPPRPSEADQEGPEPMAVARDKMQTHGESFVATTAPRDQYDPEVARRYAQVPVRRAASTRESGRAERPDGYSAPDEEGWVHLEEEE